jgi:hypothetical protein
MLNPQEVVMGLVVKVLDLGDIELDTSFPILAREPGAAIQVPTFGFLITGGEAPVMVTPASAIRRSWATSG